MNLLLKSVLVDLATLLVTLVTANAVYYYSKNSLSSYFVKKIQKITFLSCFVTALIHCKESEEETVRLIII